MLGRDERARLIWLLGDPDRLPQAQAVLAAHLRADDDRVRRVRRIAEDWLLQGRDAARPPVALGSWGEDVLLTALAPLLPRPAIARHAATMLAAALAQLPDPDDVEPPDLPDHSDHRPGLDVRDDFTPGDILREAQCDPYDGSFGPAPAGAAGYGFSGGTRAHERWPGDSSPPASSGALPPDEADEADEAEEREMWPRLSAPASVAAGDRFPVTVGIAPERDPELIGTGALPLPVEPVELEVLVMYDPAAFAPVGWANPVRLAVSADRPHPSTVLFMTALDGPRLRSRRHIGASFHVGGSLRGYASREVEVAPSPSGAVPLFDGGLLDVRPLLEQDAPDLVVVVERGEDRRGRTLLWSTRSPLPGVAPAPGPYACDLGADPAEFARALRSGVGAHGDDARGAVLTLIGVGRRVADHIPDEVRAVISEVVDLRAPEPATVLLLSAEPHVPWELAVLDPPLPGPSPFLGAAAAVGRWVLARRRPRPVPPTRVPVQRQVVVAARYEGVVGWPRLPHAEAEADRLRELYPPCREVAALHSEVLDCLEDGPAGDVLHFALHGRHDPGDAQDGLVLLAPAEGGRVRPRFLQPDQVAAMDFTGRPFVFLNACQVGASGEVLGDYSGLAAAFLAAGAAGVVAPLWNVHDETASAFAEEFYRLAYAGVPPAEVLRRARAGVTRVTRGGRPATTLAYQFFGHPRLGLRRGGTEGIDG